MVRLQTIRLTAGFLALMVTAGCQHHRQHQQESCPCSCDAPAQPASVTPPAKPMPADTTSNLVPVAPAVRTAVGNPI